MKGGREERIKECVQSWTLGGGGGGRRSWGSGTLLYLMGSFLVGSGMAKLDCPLEYIWT